MLAHEVALLVRPPNNPGANQKTNKHRPVNEPKRQLPNGDTPTFHKSSKEKTRKSKPVLPNGDKPDFGTGDDKKDHPNSKEKLRKLKKGKNNNNSPATKNAANEANKKVSNKAASGNNNGQSTVGDMSKKSGEESYAGSSFHSSPEALALPKPSFKSSPKQPSLPLGQPSPQTPGLQHSPNQTPNHQPANQQFSNQNAGMNLHPAFVYQGMPAIPPPRYPVASYPNSVPQHPGFEYYASPQGYINYLYPPTAVPQAPMPLHSQSFVHPQNLHAPQPQFAPAGQRITFNDLMNSSK